MQLQEFEEKVTRRTGHLLCRTTCEHTYRPYSVIRLPRRTHFLKFAQALTKYAASKSVILLCGVRQLATNVFQFNIQLGVGILKVILLLPHPCQHTLASL